MAVGHSHFSGELNHSAIISGEHSISTASHQAPTDQPVSIARSNRSSSRSTPTSPSPPTGEPMGGIRRHSQFFIIGLGESMGWFQREEEGFGKAVFGFNGKKKALERLSLVSTEEKGEEEKEERLRES